MPHVWLSFRFATLAYGAIEAATIAGDLLAIFGDRLMARFQKLSSAYGRGNEPTCLGVVTSAERSLSTLPSPANAVTSYV
jgi:hypothetical protein